MNGDHAREGVDNLVINAGGFLDEDEVGGSAADGCFTGCESNDAGAVPDQDPAELFAGVLSGGGSGKDQACRSRVTETVLAEDIGGRA